MVDKTKKKGAKEFADLVDNDLKVREEVRKAAGEILKVAKKHGYNFTGKEMQEHLRKKWKIKKPPVKPPQPKDPEDPNYEDPGDGPMTTWCW